MKKTFLYALTCTILASCSMLKPTAKLEKAIAGATAQRWAGGAPGSGRGVTFRMKFYNLAEVMPNSLQADTLEINGQPLPTEVTRVGDTTYISAFFYAQEKTMQQLLFAEEYIGTLQVALNQKRYKLRPEKFTILPDTNYP